MQLVVSVVALSVLATLDVCAQGVMPDSGHYWVPSEPGRGYLIERQGNKVGFLAFGYDKDGGDPEWLTAAGNLRSDGIPPADPPPFAGYFPVNWIEAPLYRVQGGACIGCFHQPPSRTDEIGTVEIYFDYLRLPTILFRFFSPVNLPFDRVPFNVVPFNFGHTQFGNAVDGRLAAGFVDLRGDWLFVEDSEAAETVGRFHFTSYLLSPTAGDDSYTLTFSAPGQNAEMRCHEGVRAPGHSVAPFDGCELLVNGIVVLSANELDIGINRILASRGPLAPRDVGPLRHPQRVLGFRLD
jgi:hypothetical protein